MPKLTRAESTWWDSLPEVVTCGDCGRQGPKHDICAYQFTTRTLYCATGPCADARHARYAAGRAAQLAARPNDCLRCGVRPHTFLLAGWKLCGRCKTATMREHRAAQAKAGALAIFATAPLVDTSTWAAAKKG